MSGPSKRTLLFLLPFVLVAPSCFGVPDGFVEEGVTSVKAITGAFAANPRNGGKPMLFLSSKEGIINVLEDPDNSDRLIQVGDLNRKMCTNGERGLQTILPHPNFGQNRFLFMYYTASAPGCPEDAKTGPRNKLARYTVNDSTLQIDIGSEVVLLETPPAPKRMHNGGAMAFGNDGLLYITTGDAGSKDPRYSPDLRNLYGKLLRLDVNKSNMIPAGNPFAGGKGVSCALSGGRPPSGSASDAVCAEIFAYGLRNPFRLAMDVNTKDKVRFAIGDVGASTWEEISFGGTDFVGTNYAWPEWEGPCKNGSTKDCPTPGKGVTDPFYYYQHTKSAEGGAVVGGAFVPEGLWPSKYKYFFIDYVFKKLYNLVEDKGRECRTCTPPVPGYRNETFHSHDDMVDIFFGPYKNTRAMYVVSRSSGQNVRRIRYTASTNGGPVAVIKQSATSISLNGKVDFDGSGSSDEDGDALTFLWKFGDGVTSTGKNPAHTFAKLGEFMVTLTVTDTKGQTSQAFVNIVVGTPPTANMISPAVNSQFHVGQVLRLKGSAIDSAGNALDKTQLFWEVKQHHANHFHPFLDRTAGNDFDLFAAPEPEDFVASTNSYLEVIMYAVDSNGVSTSVSRKIQPKKVLIDVVTSPPGLEVLIDETKIVSPATITTWEKHNLRLNVEDQSPNVFVSWSVGFSRKTVFVVPASGATNTQIVATFSRNGSPVAVAPQTAPVTKPVAAVGAIPLVRNVRQCSASDQCGRCEGNCSSDDDCKGDLVCFVKNEGKPGVDAVPGCIGQDLSRTDWCILLSTFPVTPVVSSPRAAPVPVASPISTPVASSPRAAPVPISMPVSTVDAIPLVRTVRECTASNQCKRCEGHCSNDDDCKGDLVCFFKNEGKPGVDAVPGCIGQDLSKTDWCTLASAVMPVAPKPSPPVAPVTAIPLVRTVRKCTASNQCKRCEGHCSNDDDCKGDLVCFFKNEGKPGVDAVPGCIGQDLSKTDWCTLASAAMPVAPKPSATVPIPSKPSTPIGSDSAVPLDRTVRKCTTSKPCGRCEGNCLSDDECEGNLTCFQKGAGKPGVDAVPGCLGEDLSKTDWCTVIPKDVRLRGAL